MSPFGDGVPDCEEWRKGQDLSEPAIRKDVGSRGSGQEETL